VGHAGLLLPALALVLRQHLLPAGGRGRAGAQLLTYTEANQVGWDSLGKLGNTVVKPLYPFLGKLRPARTSVGLLLPYTQWCYNWLYPTSAVYPFANLLGAHVDVQPTCEEEVLSGDAAR